MATIASGTIALYHVIDVTASVQYFKRASSKPSKPADNTTAAQMVSAGWATTEPSYSSSNSNPVWIVTHTTYSNGNTKCSDVSRYSSYDAAITAYNQALSADKIIMSATEPTSTSDKTKIWYDMNTQKFKKWFEANPDDPDSVAEWRVISDFSNDINIVKDIATDAQTAAGQIDSKIENANAAQTTQILNEVETRTQAALSVQQTNILASVSQSIANNNTIQNVVTNFSFETTGLYIGKTDSLYKLLLANDKISMLYYENDTPIELSYWNRNLFYSTKIKTEEIEIAPFRWVKRANGSLSLRKDG